MKQLALALLLALSFYPAQAQQNELKPYTLTAADAAAINARRAANGWPLVRAGEATFQAAVATAKAALIASRAAAEAARQSAISVAKEALRSSPGDLPYA